MISVLYEDQHLIVVEKPAGIESQSARGFEEDMVSRIRIHIHKLSTKKSTAFSTGQPPYVGVIHRLDRPVRGVMVYAKTKKAAALLSAQVQEGKMRKRYRAVVCGKPVDNSGTYVDFLLKDCKINCSRIVDKSADGGKLSRLNYRVVDTREIEADGKGAIGKGAADTGTADAAAAQKELLSLVEIELLTGRHHQIRVQMAGHGTPLYGDAKYGNSPAAGPLALCAVELVFSHPITGKEMKFNIQEKGGAFDLFRGSSSEERPSADGL